MPSPLLIYLFASFSVGLACLGVVVALVLQSRSALPRAFLGFYLALSLTVFASLLLAYLNGFPQPVSPAIHGALEYVEGIVGFYGILFTFPFFVHRVFGVSSPRRDRFLLAVTVLTAVVQHGTEYGLGGRWDERGDLLENLIFAAVMTYALTLALSRRRSPEAVQPLARRLLGLMLLGIPGLLHDLFWIEATSLRLYPLWYGVLSLIITWTLYRSTTKPADDPSTAEIPDAWNLSARETEVVRLVVRGLSNKEVAAELGISSHTVKSHLRSAFEKSGCRSRFALMSAVGGAQ